ncbi:MAG: hypothetical protein MK101_04250 [Phycisphaerales bacterium]|nr:hypothetical protein [Phycisphaerales bacterium]
MMVSWATWATCLALVSVVPAAPGAPDAFLASELLAPAMRASDLSRIVEYLDLDQDQIGTVQLLLEDHLDDEVARIESLRAQLRQAGVDDEDDLAWIRDRRAGQWNPEAFAPHTPEGLFEIRSLVSDWLEEVAAHQPTLSGASGLLQQRWLERGATQEALLSDIGLLLNEAQQARWNQAVAALALARSPWRALLPWERVDLDAQLRDVLGPRAQNSVWSARRIKWLGEIAAATARRDEVLAETEGPLLDAHQRGQHERVLLLTRSRLAARRAFSREVEALSKRMSEAIEAEAPVAGGGGEGQQVSMVNAFQRGIRQAMSPRIWLPDELDRTAAEALKIEGLRAQDREAIMAAAARHRSRRAAVQSHLALHESGVVERSVLRPIEQRMLASMLGQRVSLITLDEADDVPVAETRRLQTLLRDARRMGRAELDAAIPEAHLGEIERRVRQHLQARRAAAVEAVPGEAGITLPGFGDESKP